MTQADYSANYPVPDYLKPVVMFDDLASSRVMLLADCSDGLWLHYWHVHAKNWVTLRKANERDLQILQGVIEREGVTQVRR